jgi:hypothetical protein
MALLLLVGALVTVGAELAGRRRRTEDKIDNRPQRLGL